MDQNGLTEAHRLQQIVTGVARADGPSVRVRRVVEPPGLPQVLYYYSLEEPVSGSPKVLIVLPWKNTRGIDTKAGGAWLICPGRI